jgi:hypothetical protein
MVTTPQAPIDTGNPFDVPLNSELQESQQRQQVAQSAPDYNPFDEPLASEKAEAAHAATVKANPASNFASGSKVPNAILNGSDTTGDIIGGVTGAGVAALAASPIIDAAIAHLGNLTKIVQVAKQLGWASFGMKEAHDLYKMVSGNNK